MRLLIKLAWRNIWRNRRRSIITILAVAFAVMLTVATRGLQLGTYEVNIQSVVRLYSGFLQIQRPGYQDNPTLRKSFPYTKKLRSILDSQALITGYAPRVYADALISYRDNSYGTMLVGIDLERERKISNLLKKIRQGREPESGRGNEILIGEKLLKNLNAQIGDSIIVLVQGFDGFLRDSFCKITGTFRMGSDEFDRTVILMPIHTLQELLGLENRVSVIAISLEKLDHLEPAKKSLQKALTPLNLNVLTWDEVMPSFKQSIELDNIGGILFLAILVIVVAFGILNTVLMSVTERFREFGIILALGMPQRKLVTLVAFEILFLVFIGISAGNLLGGLVNWYIIHHPIEFSGEFAAIYEEYGFLPIMTSTLKLHIFVNTTLSVLAAAFVASLYPLRKVAKLEPLKGIRYT
jgi:ABC-type lipoprotein release transport system permease subunit